jgi:hypothetical protein
MGTKAKVSEGAKSGATPHLRRATRGRPFQEGNTYGVSTRYVKGQTGNPGGRPSTAKYSEALRRGFAMRPDEKLPMNTNAEVTAAKVIRKARKGSLPYIREAGDRAEGRPSITINTGESRDNIRELIDSMHRKSAEIGMPEGHREPRLLADGGEDRSQ